MTNDEKKACSCYRCVAEVECKRLRERCEEWRLAFAKRINLPIDDSGDNLHWAAVAMGRIDVLERDRDKWLLLLQRRTLAKEQLADEAEALAIEADGLRAELRAAVDALRNAHLAHGYCAACDRAAAIVAAYDAKHPEGK